MRWRPECVGLLVFFLASLPCIRATSVVPPSFPELVAEAEAIYRAEVTSVAARRVPRPDGGSVIKTFVSFVVERTLKGEPRRELTLEFLGGTVGEETLAIHGMPSFARGQREFVFVQKNGVQLCPLVALMHGRYRVIYDAVATREYVARDNGVPLTDPAEVELPMTALPERLLRARQLRDAPHALTPAAFEQRIQAELAQSNQQHLN